MDKSPFWKQVSDTFGKYTSGFSKKYESIFGKGSPKNNAPESNKRSGDSLLSEYRYGGLTSKEYRNKIKEQRLGHLSSKSDEQAVKKTVDENPDAGANVVLHKDSRWKEAWNNFKDSNPIVQGKTEILT